MWEGSFKTVSVFDIEGDNERKSDNLTYFDYNMSNGQKKMEIDLIPYHPLQFSPYTKVCIL